MNIKACGGPHNFARLIIYPVSSIAWASKSANCSKLGAGLEVKYHILRSVNLGRSNILCNLLGSTVDCG